LPKLVRAAELARQANISPQRVCRLIKEKRINRNEKMLIDLDHGLKVIKAGRLFDKDILKNESKFEKTELKDIAAERLKHEKYKVLLLELEYLEKKGELIERKEVIEKGQLIVNTVKSRLLSLASILSPLVAPEMTAREAEVLIRGKIIEVLTELAKMENL